MTRKVSYGFFLVLLFGMLGKLLSAETVATPPLNAALKLENGSAQIQFPASADSYYLLETAPTPAGPWTASLMKEGSGFPTGGLFQKPVATETALFYRVTRIPLDSPRDSDGDGVDDVFELRRPVYLKPFVADGPTTVQGRLQLKSRADYDSIAHRDNFPGANGLREAKLLFADVNTSEPILHFLNTATYVYHYDYARYVLGRYAKGYYLGIYPLEGAYQSTGYYNGLYLFNNSTYFLQAGRLYLAGSLVAYDNYTWPDGRKGLYAMEFWPTDVLPMDMLQLAWKQLNLSAPFLGDRLVYHPAGETQTAQYTANPAAFAAAGIPVIDTDTLFGALSFQMLNPGLGYGRLVVAEPGVTVSARDVVIYDTLPNDLPRTAGILTTVPQTPLSHINLKAKQNNTPNGYARDALIDPAVLSLLGKTVRFEVTADGYTLAPADPVEAAAYLEALRPTAIQYPVRDLTAWEIKPLTVLGFADSRAYGSKTANVAELQKLLPAGQAPETGFGIPFFLYDKFMQWNGFYDEYARLAADPRFQSDPSFRDTQLAAFRNLIRSGEVPSWMSTLLNEVQAKFPSGTPIRCRSSTNHEDLDGFNGAGLYDSHTHRPEEGPLSETVKQVWSGLWTFRAHDERDFYRVDQKTAAMAVLLTPNTDNEIANGVAVTKNIFDPNWEGYYVNAQVGEDLVTNPQSGSLPEEFLVANLLDNGNRLDYEVQYVRSSNRVPAGTRVLSKTQIFSLVDSMKKIQSHFANLYGKTGDRAWGMEIEWKIRADGTLLIKQARPWVY